MKTTDTIYAVSSGRGRAGIAVVRLSGTSCLRLVKDIAGLTPAPRHAHFTTLRDPVSGDVVDKSLTLYFPGPTSVTGEDVLEFHVHGSTAIIQRLFSVFRHYDDLRPAEPGEFTRRAFTHDRLDLVEVEGLADLLAADSEPQRKLAMRQFLGHASNIYESWRRNLVAAIALVEASIDFSDEAGVADVALRQVRPQIRLLLDELETALAVSLRVSAIRNGVRLVIGGPPNVGKSTLLNLLVDRDAAIVSPVAGTTRDVIEAVTLIAGIPVSLVDTAGVRDAVTDEIEAVGIERARAQIEDADILVWMTAPDAVGSPWGGRRPDLILFNKMDLNAAKLIQVRNESNGVSVLGLSLKTGFGVDELKSSLARMVETRFSSVENAVVVRERHSQAVRKSADILQVILQSDSALELMADDMRRAAHSLASVTGRVDVEDFLGQIFSEFCIGK
jgi:tRNA modification GTPase